MADMLQDVGTYQKVDELMHSLSFRRPKGTGGKPGTWCRERLFF